MALSESAVLKYIKRFFIGGFSIKLEAIVRSVGNLRIKEVLSIAKLHPQINSRLELNTEYMPIILHKMEIKCSCI